MTFHARGFLAHLSPAVLERHLRKRCGEIADAVDWSAPADELRAALLAAITGHPRGADDVIPCLERVHRLADELGERAMAAVGALAESHEFLASVEDRALDLLDRDERLFDRAEETRHADWYAAGKQWSGFLGPRDRRPELSAESLGRLKARLEEIFLGLDGSGT